MTDLITQMEAALATLDAQRTALQAAIQALRGANGAGAAPQSATPTNTRHARPQAAKRATPRPTAAPSARREAILAALNPTSGTSIAAIVRATKLVESQVRYTLKTLCADGSVVASGRTTDRVFRLP